MLNLLQAHFILSPFIFFSTCFVRLETERALFLFLLSHLLVVARRIIIMYYDYDIIALATQCRDQIPQFECRFVGMATENTNQKLNRNGTTKKIRTKREPKQLVRAASFCLVVTLNKNGNEWRRRRSDGSSSSSRKRQPKTEKTAHWMHAYTLSTHIERARSLSSAHTNEENKNKIPYIAGEFDSNSNECRAAHC